MTKIKLLAKLYMARTMLVSFEAKTKEMWAFFLLFFLFYIFDIMSSFVNIDPNF